jgi:L-cystine uptake protein TcyP (sodium:dicarboxylate symporter family)
VTIGAAIFIAALGAILRYAVSDNIEGIDLQTVGTILIIAGVVGLIVGLALAMSNRDAAVRDDRDRARARDDRF